MDAASGTIQIRGGRKVTDAVLINTLKQTNNELKQIRRDLKLMRETLQRMAPPPRELDIPDLETYCEMLEEGEEE